VITDSDSDDGSIKSLDENELNQINQNIEMTQ